MSTTTSSPPKAAAPAGPGKNGTKTPRSSKASRKARCRSRRRNTRPRSDIPSLNEITDHAYPRFDLEIPDQYRYDIWKEEFENEEHSHSVPNLTLIWLPDDHTGGAPQPVAQEADNDLAMGKIIEKISHSKVWKESAIFGVEDDTQNGVDHVDGHRGPAFVISPYSKGGVDNEYASQPNMVRTVEQILGIQPMNQEDYSAEPMYSAFTEKPNFAPYTAEPNQIPLTLGVKGLPQTLPSTGGSSGSGPRIQGAGADGEGQRVLEPVEEPPAVPGHGRQTRLGQAAPARPLRLVLGARLEAGVSRATRRSTCRAKCRAATSRPR